MTSKRLLIRDLMLCVNTLMKNLHGYGYTDTPTLQMNMGNTRIEYVFRYSGALTEFFVAS